MGIQPHEWRLVQEMLALTAGDTAVFSTTEGLTAHSPMEGPDSDILTRSPSP